MCETFSDSLHHATWHSMMRYSVNKDRNTVNEEAGRGDWWKTEGWRWQMGDGDGADENDDDDDDVYILESLWPEKSPFLFLKVRFFLTAKLLNSFNYWIFLSKPTVIHFYRLVFTLCVHPELQRNTSATQHTSSSVFSMTWKNQNVIETLVNQCK